MTIPRYRGALNRRASSKARALLAIYKRLYKAYGPQGWWPGDSVPEIIAGAILTQNTAWTNVEKAITNLKKARLLSIDALKDIEIGRLARLIRPSGYYNIKAERLKNFVDFAAAKYRGRLEAMAGRRHEVLRNELLGVNGIGPETADSILLYAFGKPVFVIDAYTKRIFSRHGFFEPGVRYHEAQELFMGLLPKSARLFNEYHALIVRLAKDACRKKPECGRCPIKGIPLSPFGERANVRGLG